MNRKKLTLGALTLVAGLAGTLLTSAGAEVWAAKGDHESRVKTLEGHDESAREMLGEMRQDQREMRQDIKELLRRSDASPR